ncbi:MAG TPA: hypothetical protein VN541_24315 [Tepidisphaeraceae bacterium]|nr:hypothetical protein [Tepidisphaeraceae bacterium]
MANTSRKKSGRSGNPDSSKTSMDAKRTSKSISTRRSARLDGVTDAPESGEPREQGRSRGRVIESAGTRKTPSQGSVARKGTSSARTARSNPKGPRAAQRRDESGDTANEAWESGRQKAMD